MQLENGHHDAWCQYQEIVNRLHSDYVACDKSGRSGYVYAFHMVHGAGELPKGYELVKIGRSRDPGKRLRSIQKTEVVMPFEVRPWLQFWAEDMHDAEALLHKLLRLFRRNGEWFLLPPEALHALDSLWYIGGSRRHAGGLTFRDNWSGAIHTPIGFFQTEIRLYEESNSRIRAQQMQAG